ncbi:uncharacterized protein LOC106013270 [Aplysia californica]|uniref:Uncharacterized protein LOC106013270 n=1 Tax=Aplysia californica TaxID=6500 RepID=A0ABM1AAG0_APLCA|nr:uncharacterized protein LOC106013270 [Aplysia californica]
MTQGGGSRKEATKPRNLLSTRRTTRLGTWNVRTMYEAGKALQVAREMEAYQLDILGLCETRWTNAGECQLASGETVLYSGHLEKNSPHTEGVGILLSTHAKMALIGWKTEGPRLISAEFRSHKKDINFHVIQGYASTNDKDQDVKETFYKMLLNTIDQIHKSTWVSPDQQTENQIDHICVNKKDRRSMRDFRVYRKCRRSFGQNLLISTIRQKLKRRQGIVNNHRHRYNVEFLREPSSREEFNVAVKNRFQVLETLGEDSSVKETWQAIKEGWTTVCQEVLGKQKREHKPWISATTLRKIEDRKKKNDQVNRSKTRAAKAKAQEEYTKAIKEVKVSVRQDKRNYVDDLAREAQEAAGAGNMRGLYETTKKLAGRYKNAGVPVKDKEGRLFTNPDEQKERWKEHFKELLNRPRPEKTV